MRIEILLICYSLISLCPLSARWVFSIDDSWLWFINDISYGLKVIILALPIFIKIRYQSKDWIDVINLSIFGLLLFTNILVIFNDYKFLDIYDGIFWQPRLLATYFLLVGSIYQLKRSSL